MLNLVFLLREQHAAYQHLISALTISMCFYARDRHDKKMCVGGISGSTETAVEMS